jgi:hypothetical protein
MPYVPQEVHGAKRKYIRWVYVRPSPAEVEQARRRWARRNLPTREQYMALQDRLAAMEREAKELQNQLRAFVGQMG